MAQKLRVTISSCWNCGYGKDGTPPDKEIFQEAKRVVPRPPQYSQGQFVPQPSQIRDYLIPSVISILFCGILGIVATIYAVQAKHRLKYGDLVGAYRASTNVHSFMYAAYLIGIILAILSFINVMSR